MGYLKGVRDTITANVRDEDGGGADAAPDVATVYAEPVRRRQNNE
jgi:hypothetical protein